MNTFFWGYFTTPWKRLIRTISIIIILFFSFTLFDSHSDSDKMICVFVLLSIPILSYVIEPFILRNRSIKKNTQVVIKNEESKMSLKSESMIKKNSTNIEVNNQSSLRKYFTYDNEYTNGATYFIRMIIGTISIPIFFIGIYLMSTTVYKRTFSFGLNKTLSIINCIIVPLLLCLSIIIYENHRRFGFSDDLFIYLIPLIFTITHFILWFKNGKRKKLGNFK